MRTFFLILIHIYMLNLSVFSAEKDKLKMGVNKELIGSFNFTQNKFDNWSQGGEDSWSWLLGVRGQYILNQPKYIWSNSGRLSYGKTKVGNLKSRKSSDEIKAESEYKYKVSVFMNPYIAVSGETQLAKGYRYTGTQKIEISDFFDPAYFMQSMGVGYSPDKRFKTRLGIALKQTITSDHPQPYADDPTTEKIEKTKFEAGSESVTEVRYKLAENILLNSKLELFSNLQGYKEIDMDWETLLSSKISKYLSVSFTIELFYDRDISLKRQLKQVLAVGVSYSFI